MTTRQALLPTSGQHVSSRVEKKPNKTGCICHFPRDETHGIEIALLNIFRF